MNFPSLCAASRMWVRHRSDQTTNVIPKLNVLNRLHIYELLMSIKIENVDPHNAVSFRCVCRAGGMFVVNCTFNVSLIWFPLIFPHFTSHVSWFFLKLDIPFSPFFGKIG